MKKIIPLIIIIVGFGFSSCEKDEIHNTDTKVGISDVTVYPVLTMAGSPYVSIVQGGTYTEAGVTAKEGTSTIDVTTTGSVNTGQPGLYVITYSATNKDGFPATVSRTVVVLSAHENAGVDLSGKYDYVAGGYTSTVTKVAEGVYTTDNVWNAATIIPVVFISLDGLTISVPNQNTGYGPIFGTGTYNPATKRLVYTLNLPNYGISNSNRNWQKQ
ncbi:MAG TPA: immunoglobulin-like domain-containing protein [Flavisolibacter sp.]|nr:immunoglobulin-like domain-containing protein [Flavisolibacter sp.]